MHVFVFFEKISYGKPNTAKVARLKTTAGSWHVLLSPPTRLHVSTVAACSAKSRPTCHSSFWNVRAHPSDSALRGSPSRLPKPSFSALQVQPACAELATSVFLFGAHGLGGLENCFGGLWNRSSAIYYQFLEKICSWR